MEKCKMTVFCLLHAVKCNYNEITATFDISFSRTNCYFEYLSFCLIADELYASSGCFVTEKETNSIKECSFPFSLSGKTFHSCTTFGVSMRNVV